MTYQWKSLPEAYWSVLTALFVAAAQIAVEFDPSRITDWKVWAVAGAGALVRAAGGGLLAYLTKRGLVGGRG